MLSEIVFSLKRKSGNSNYLAVERENGLTILPVGLSLHFHEGRQSKMTTEQKDTISRLRRTGLNFSAIAESVGLPVGTVKTFCYRNAVTPSVATDKHVCLCCGKEVPQNPGRKEKKFCSDRCRNTWWNRNLDKVNRKANYKIICACCKKEFISYGNASRKYCSHECYVEDRFGGGAHD